MKIELLKTPNLELVDGGYKLVTQGIVIVGCYSYIAPCGMFTNFASVPKKLRWYIDNDEDGIRIPSIFHDGMYSGEIEVSSRYEADAIFRDFCRQQGLSIFKAWAAWAALRLFGSENWRNKQ